MLGTVEGREAEKAHTNDFCTNEIVAGGDIRDFESVVTAVILGKSR